MSLFDPIKLTWDGKNYIIPSNKVVRAIARIEQEAITIEELSRFGSRKTVPPATLALAYATLLRYAGADATDDDVYKAMFGRNADEAGIAGATNILMVLMTPVGIEASKKANPTKRPMKAAHSASLSLPTKP